MSNARGLKWPLLMQPDIRLKLQTYHDLLAKWQKSVNLIAPSTLSEAWKRHFEDSLQLVQLIPADAKRLVDIGSGAGFPGLVIALARPDLHVTLVESDTKKCTFLLAVSRETGAQNVDVKQARIDEVLPQAQFDVVTARALASLSELLVMTESQWNCESSKKRPMLIFPKGEDWEREVEMARRDQFFEWSAKPSKTARGAAILCITNVRKLTNP